MLPAASRATDASAFRFADVAGPVSPPYLNRPLPAMVEMMPADVTLRSLRLISSAMYRLPAESTATASGARGSPPPAPPRPDSRPAPPGFAPPRARSRCAAHLHHGLPVSPAPTPGSRRASGTS